jgi:transcriptional regulator with XRE-family HTH domain
LIPYAHDTTSVFLKSTVVVRCMTTNVLSFRPMNLGGRLLEARTRRGMTQERLAELAQTSQAVISALEIRDSKATELLFNLADALKVNPRWLLTGEGESWLDSGRRAEAPAEDMWARYQQAPASARQAIDILLSEESLRQAARQPRAVR